MDINERFALWGKKYKPHGEHEELLYIIAKDAVAALSSPHPEARGEDEAWEKCRAEREPVTGSDDWTVGEVGTYRGFFNAGYEAALSRLAAQKDEGQDWRETRFVLPKERGKYLCLFAGRKQEVLYWDNEDWYDTAGIRSPKYWMPLPAAPDPRPAEEPFINVENPDTHLVEIHVNPNYSEPAPAAPSEELEKIISDWLCDHGDEWEGVLDINDLAKRLRSQLARKDEGLREAADRAIEALKISCSLFQDGHIPCCMQVDAEKAIRAALREPDGRKGE